MRAAGRHRTSRRHPARRTNGCRRQRCRPPVPGDSSAAAAARSCVAGRATAGAGRRRRWRAPASQPPPVRRRRRASAGRPPGADAAPDRAGARKIPVPPARTAGSGSPRGSTRWPAPTSPAAARSHAAGRGSRALRRPARRPADRAPPRHRPGPAGCRAGPAARPHGLPAGLRPPAGGSRARQAGDGFPPRRPGCPPAAPGAGARRGTAPSPGPARRATARVCPGATPAGSVASAGRRAG